MKLKRFLALVVSLAMVLSLVPAFSLTASAAATTAEIVLFDGLVASGEKDDLASDNAGWSDSENGAKAAWNQNWGPEGTGVWGGGTGTYGLMFFNNGTACGNVTATIDMASQTANASMVKIDYNFATQVNLTLGETWYFRDINGNTFATVDFDLGSTIKVTSAKTAIDSTLAENHRGSNFVITAEKQSDGSTLVTYTVNGSVVATETIASATGFGSIYCEVHSGSSGWAAAALQDLRITYVDETVDFKAVPTPAAGTQVTVDGATYDVVSGTNLVPNPGFETTAGDFSLLHWNSAQTKAVFAKFGTQTHSYKVDASNYYYFNSSDSLGSSSSYDGWSFGSRWNDGPQGLCSLFNNFKVEKNKKYYVSFYAKATASDDALIYLDAVENVKTDPVSAETWRVSTDSNTIITDWTKFEKVIDMGENEAIQFNAYWLGQGGTGAQPYFLFDNFVIVEIEVPASYKDITATYTLDGTTVHTKTVTIDTNETTTASFDTYYYSANGSNVMYKADAITNTSENVTVELTETVANTDNVYSEGGSITVGEQTGTIASGNLIPNADFVYGIAGWYAADGSEAASANFTTDSNAGSVFIVNNGGSSSANTLQRSWAIESGKTYVFTYNQTQTSTDKKWQRFCLGNDFANNNDAMLSGAGAGDEETGQSVVEGTNTVVFTNSDGYKYANFRAAYSEDVTFSDFGLYEVTGLTNDYNVTYVDTNGTSLKDAATITALTVDALEIPYFKGYIFKERTASGLNVTFTYEATEASLGSWAIRNNVVNEAYITEMKYLGSHNAFANNDSPVDNEGGALRNSVDNILSGYTVPGATAGSLATSMSQTQTLDALDQLNAGVRYFDIRLTRQSDGTYWTFHGPAFCDFKPIATTIAQFAKENPGEIIIIDFQAAWDALYKSPLGTSDNNTYNGETVGDDNQDFYDDLVVLLKNTGLWDYMPDNWDQRYGALTSNGTKTAVIPIAKGRGANCVDKFVYRGGYDADKDVLTMGGTSDTYTYTESSTFSTVVSKIQSAVDTMEFGNGARLGTIHAYLTGSNLLTLANNNNDSWVNQNLDAWMAKGYGDVFLMNGITKENAAPILARLSEYNRDYMNNLLGSEIIDYNNDWADDNKDGIVSGDVTLTGDYTVMPYSTKFSVIKNDPAKASYDIGGVIYTSISDYTLDFLQFNRDSVPLTGTATFTFDTANDPLKSYALIVGGELYQNASAAGADLTVTADNLQGPITVTLVETDAPGADMTINYQDNGTTVFTVEKFVVYGYEAYNIPAGKFWIVNDDNSDAAILESASEQSYTVTEAVDGTANTVNIPVTLIERHAVLEDALVTGNGGKIYGANSWNDNYVFAGAGGNTNGVDLTGVDYDADGVRLVNNTPSGLTYSRTGLMQFPVVDLGDDEAAIAVMPIQTWHENSFSNENPWIRLSAYALKDNSWTTMADETVYNPTDSSKLLVVNPVFTGQNTSATTELKFDVTEFMQAAKAEGLEYITIRIATSWGGCYMVQTEDAVAGGAQAGKAAYIDVVEANTVSVLNAASVTKMGSAVVDGAETIVVPVGNTIRVRETSSSFVAFTDDKNIYVTNSDGYATITPETTGEEYYPVTVGANMVDGAQVRIGDGVDGDGKVALTSSGLRFISTIDTADSLAHVIKNNYYDASTKTFTEGYEIGVKVTAEGGSDPAYIPATKWQQDDVYTSALTNLAVGNFNRTFTAVPYVKVNGTVLEGTTTVDRSIYEVAAGLLTNNMVDSDLTGDNKYPEAALVAKSMIDVLNAYVNQTGIRLQINDDGLGVYQYKEGEKIGASYSGDVFFEVTKTAVNGTVYTATIAPVGEKTVINSEYWDEYIRINNNHNMVVNGIDVSSTVNEDGTLTLTFDASKATK